MSNQHIPYSSVATLPNKLQGSGSSSYLSGVKASTMDFLNAVHDPFNATRPARVPDLEQSNTICFKDYADHIEVASPAHGYGTGDWVGCLILFSYGTDTLTRVICGTLSDTTALEYAWRLWMIPYTSDNVLYASNAVSLTFINTQQIIGGDSSSYGYGGLCERFRLFAAGLKILPTIETITTSTTVAILNLWGGLITPTDILNTIGGEVLDSEDPDGKHDDDFDSPKSVVKSRQIRKTGKRMCHSVGSLRLKASNTGGSVLELVRNAINVKEFPNNFGCTVRHNPFQAEEQLEYMSIEDTNWTIDAPVESDANPPVWNTATYQLPFINVMFTLPVAAGGSNVFPFKLYATAWVEGLLIQPTPIYSDRSPCDPKYDEIRAYVSNIDKFPIAVSGHTFKSFIRVLGNSAGEFLSIVDKGVNLYQQMRKVMNKGPAKAKKQKKSKPKQKKPNKSSNNQRIKLAGMGKPTKLNKNIRNS